jgi:hypothetical protein
VYSAIIDPSIFGPNSASSLQDFLLFISADRTSSGVSLVHELTEELVSQQGFDEVATNMFAAVYAMLNAPPHTCILGETHTLTLNPPLFLAVSTLFLYPRITPHLLLPFY